MWTWFIADVLLFAAQLAQQITVVIRLHGLNKQLGQQTYVKSLTAARLLDGQFSEFWTGIKAATFLKGE